LAKCSDWMKDDINDRMRFREMEQKYPNPADRFVKSVNISKQLQKEVFSIDYSSVYFSGSYILFHIVENKYSNDKENISALKIETESASYILPFIEDIYPYIYKRYYSENHIPTEMWGEILVRLKSAKKMILTDTYNPELLPYIERFNLFVLSTDNKEDLKIRENPMQFLHKHRHKVAHLFDIFIKWSEAQLWCYGYEERMFNIEGP